MVLIDALYINDGGGKVLLDYLMCELNLTTIEVDYILDKRITDNYIKPKSGDSIFFMKADLLQRDKFYRLEKKRKKYSKILCFGNLPPSRKIEGTVYTFFQQALFLEIPQEFNLKKKITYNIKKQVVSLIKKNTDYWITQSTHIQQELNRKFKINKEGILVAPFYPSFESVSNERSIKQKNTYLYVSSGEKHKNHEILFRAFAEFYKTFKIGILTVTIGDEFDDLKKLIQEYAKESIPIKNIGFIKRDKLQILYQSNEFFVYPSLNESFGLGIVEAIENGCKIIGADLPYMYAVCKPSIIFDPHNHFSLVRAFENSIKNTKESKSLVRNNIDIIINLLS